MRNRSVVGSRRIASSGRGRSLGDSDGRHVAVPLAQASFLEQAAFIADVEAETLADRIDYPILPYSAFLVRGEFLMLVFA
jgi:hypothetical protein